ncbi:MAG: hypothetical protein R6V16_08170 [Bacteroidales bacterium]
MKRKLFTVILIISGCFFNLNAQDADHLKDKAMEEFKKENYPEAIQILKNGLKEHPDDADIYYYLGFFTHYNAYDSRPLAGYNDTYSDTVFNYLDKAIELNPNHGDAKYFYAAESGAAALNAVKAGKPEKFKFYYQKAYDKGAFPDWAIEYGKITLDLCKKDALLFTHGDFVLNVCWYLQFIENYRPDISVIPLALLDRPWFAIALKKGSICKKVNMSVTENQLIDMHPYKWDSTLIQINVPEALKRKYSLPLDFKMEWSVNPDFTTHRIVSKISGEKAKPRTYLSAHRALLLDIIETNQWERPVYFTAGFEEFYLAGLNKNFQYGGLVSKLLPFETDGTDWEFDFMALENLVFDVSYQNYKKVLDDNQPRVSGILNNYKSPFWILAHHYKENGEAKKLTKLIENYKNKMLIGFFGNYEKQILESLENL